MIKCQLQRLHANTPPLPGSGGCRHGIPSPCSPRHIIPSPTSRIVRMRNGKATTNLTAACHWWGGRSRVGGPPALVNQVDTKELVAELGAGSSSSAFSTSPSTPACSVDDTPDDSDWPIKPMVWMTAAGTTPRQCTPLSSPPPPRHCTPLSSPHPWLYSSTSVPLALSSPESLAAIPSPDQNMCSLMVTLRGSLLREEQRASSALEEYLRARDGISRGSK